MVSSPQQVAPAALDATTAELIVDLPAESSGPLDVLFDGRRVWSVGGAEWAPGHNVLPWPAALLPFLHGVADIAVRLSATGEILAAGFVRLGESDARVAVADPDGAALVVNKWGRMSHSLEGADSALDRLLDHAELVLGLLGELGLQAYLVGGSLLGAMRSGDFLPHDDDIDLAYLSEHSSPADLTLESYRIQRHVEAAGLVIIRHSSAHLQVLFYGAGGTVQHYVDIFTAFYKDGSYCQPFAIRGTLELPDVVPTSTVTLRGREFPAPAVPAAWLTLAYGPWETPDPSFRFVTPETTTRRFHAWFGSYHFQREFWSEWLGERLAGSDDPSDEAREFAAGQPDAGLVIEVGAGTGADARFLAGQGHEVWALDYAFQYGHPPFPATPGLSYRMVNVAETRAAVKLAVEAERRGRPVSVYGRHVLAALAAETRANLLRVMASLRRLRGGFFIFDTDLPTRHSHEDPTTWHLPLDVFEAECARAGLTFELVRESERPTAAGPRRSAAVRVSP